MFKGIRTILFPTDLSKNCIPAFDFTMALSLQFKARIILLHVKEKIPDYVEGRLEGLLGETQWEEMIYSYENSVRQKLIGKRSSNKLIQEALNYFCTEHGTGEVPEACPDREIVIGDGDIANSIIETSRTHKCDLIILGSHTGLFSQTSVGSTLKSVIKRSKIPVLIIPRDGSVETA